MFIDSINYHHFLLALRALCNSYHTNIYVSNTYVVVATQMHNYLIGIADGDNRLFVNKIDTQPFGDELVTSFTSFKRGDRRITIYTMRDKEVWEILGYKYDVATSEEVVIDEPGIYRVQGDLLLEVIEYVPLDFLSLLIDLQERLLADVLLRVLSEMRVSARLGINNNVIIPLKIPVKDVKTAIQRIDDVVKMTLEKATTALYAKLKELGLARNVKHLIWKAIIEGDGDYRNCTIQVFDGGSGHGYKVLPHVTVDLMITPKCERGDIEGTLLEKLYQDLMRLYKPTTFELSVGNHHIRLQNARSLIIRYKPAHQPLLLGDLTLEINERQDWYHVTPESIITIMHNEHGIKTVRFAREFRVRFRTLNLSIEHDQERNAIALNLLDLFFLS
jgi:hypothetical protein